MKTTSPLTSTSTGQSITPARPLAEQWVAIFGGGYDDASNPNGSLFTADPNAAGWSDAGKAIFMVSLDTGATAGVLLAPGGGSWSAVSDRDSKENVEPVDGRAILERLLSMPLSTWNYKAQDDSIRHMGPMAQDFHAAFGLGVSDKLIDTIDPDGVALAAIQGLNTELQERLAEKDAEIADLHARLERLELLAMSK